ncbi:17505_t:CDS:2 [Gigaspora margarita]|uniref:17505_t:CDS:1 n=1 Tax=Gigaspora margarita TaxID=4874 RepID=A0ABN7UXR2_GIGMA|nr:17505_t:CDS:2 [Gigaspora margarita]
MATGMVNATVKRITNHARLGEKYSGYSLHIGRATGAIKARLTLPQIMRA